MPDDVSGACDLRCLREALKELARGESVAVITDDVLAIALPGSQLGGQGRAYRHGGPALLGLPSAFGIQPNEPAGFALAVITKYNLVPRVPAAPGEPECSDRFTGLQAISLAWGARGPEARRCLSEVVNQWLGIMTVVDPLLKIQGVQHLNALRECLFGSLPQLARVDNHPSGLGTDLGASQHTLGATNLSDLTL